MTTLTEMPKYEAYKDSGIEWIGQIPIHWKLKKLKFISFINKQSLPENTSKSLTFEYVDIGSVTLEKGIEKVEVFAFSDAPSRARRMANEGDTVVSTVRTYLKAIAYVDDISSKYIYSTGFAVVTPKCLKFSKYLTGFIKSDAFTKQVDDVAKGMSYPAINSTDLSNLFIADPPESEHISIANFLDEKTAKIDEAIAIKEKHIELLKERKQIIIQQAVTQGLDPTVPMKDSGVEWIGQIPAHWTCPKLKLVCNFILDGTHGSYPRVDVGYRLLSVRNIVNDEFVFRDDDSRVSYKHFKEISSKFKVSEGDIQLAIVGATLGKVAVVESLDENIVTQRSLATIRVNAEIINGFSVANFLRSKSFQNYLWLNTSFSAQPGVYLNTIQNSYIPVAPKEEQDLIDNYIDSEINKLSVIIENNQMVIEKLKEYKTTLINSAVTGKIKVV